MSITIKEFRLPSKEGREKMTIEELIKTRDLYFQWYMMHEESMTFEDADKCWAHLSEFEDYIDERQTALMAYNGELDEE